MSYHRNEISPDFKGHMLLTKPKEYVVIDIETTGLSASKDFITEVSAIRFQDGEEQDRFTSLLCPPEKRYNGYYTQPRVAEMTGITNDMLETAPLTSDVMPKVADFLQNYVLVGHNVEFDIGFLYNNYVREDLPPMENDYIDTLRIAKDLYPNMSAYKLGDLANRFHVNYNGAHRALRDCYITKAVFDNMSKDMSLMVDDPSWNDDQTRFI